MGIEPTPSSYQRNALPLGQTGSQSYVMYSVNIPDPEAFWLQPVMAVTASVQPESAWIVYAGSDFPRPF